MPISPAGCPDSSSTLEQVQQHHHEHISDERYACIFGNLAEFDKQKQLSTSKYPSPLVRAALCRAQFKMSKNQPNHSMKLLCLTAKLAFNLPHSSLTPILYTGLKQASRYRENILTDLWNYQLLDERTEQAFNRWLANQSSHCSICYLFTANKKHPTEVHSPSRRCLFTSEVIDDTQQDSHNEILQCSSCHVSVHRNCYDCLCLALNADITNEYDPWLCQRCSLKFHPDENAIDDRCSACLLRGGLLLYPQSSSSFIHAVCSIHQAYQSSSESNSCYYCWPFCPLTYRRISTHNFASCKHPKCPNSFHVTCGLLGGCTFQLDQDQSAVEARCHLHAATAVSSPSSSNINSRSSTIDEIDEKTKEYCDSLTDEGQQPDEVDEASDSIVAEGKRVPAGARVLIHDTKEQQIGQVIKSEISYHYSVDFGDDTYSHDMLAEDILDSDPSALLVGSNVRIKWTDGTIYTCKYLGRKRVLLYHIKTQNEVRQMQRNEFSVDIQPPSPPPTPCETECEPHCNRPSTFTTTTSKRLNPHATQQIKRKRRRLVLSSSSDDDEC